MKRDESKKRIKKPDSKSEEAVTDVLKHAENLESAKYMPVACTNSKTAWAVLHTGVDPSEPAFSSQS